MSNIIIKDAHESEECFNRMGYRGNRATCGNCKYSDNQENKLGLFDWFCRLYSAANIFLPISISGSCNYWQRK